MKTYKAAELVEDFDLYPRNNVDSQHVKHLVEALAAGEELPPGIIDKKTKRLIDGFHRKRARIQLYGPDAEMEVIEKTYKNDAEMFLDAMRYNAAHGVKLDQCDRTHCVIIAERLSIPLEAVAGALHVPIERLGMLRTHRTALGSSGLTIPLKRTISHFAGKRLNKAQAEANEKLSGMNQAFYANQLIMLIENRLLDLEDERLMDRLKVLHEALEGLLVA